MHPEDIGRAFGTEVVRDALLHSNVSLAYGVGPDLRDYGVAFSRLEENVPELSLHRSVKGIQPLRGAYTEHGLTYDDFMSSCFV